MILLYIHIKLKIHINITKLYYIITTQILMFECELCSFKFKLKADLNKHMHKPKSCVTTETFNNLLCDKETLEKKLKLYESHMPNVLPLVDQFEQRKNTVTNLVKRVDESKIIFNEIKELVAKIKKIDDSCNQILFQTDPEDILTTNTMINNNYKKVMILHDKIL
jgi:hypothetical protein